MYRTHGLYNHPLYQVWGRMLQRCENPNRRDYPRYGGRGIKVCPEWHDVSSFISWIEENIGPRPEGKYENGRPLYELDRIDNDGNYAPGNVRWATKSEQARNRRRPVKPPMSPAHRAAIARGAKARAATPEGRAQMAAAIRSRWDKAHAATEVA